jgi:hypothetical protein
MSGQLDKLTINVGGMRFVNMTEGPGVHIEFDGQDQDRKVQMSGFVPVPQEVYFAHSQSLQAMSELVRSELLKKLEPTEEPAAE